jgi:hypothetical protein
VWAFADDPNVQCSGFSVLPKTRMESMTREDPVLL